MFVGGGFHFFDIHETWLSIYIYRHRWFLWGQFRRWKTPCTIELILMWTLIRALLILLLHVLLILWVWTMVSRGCFHFGWWYRCPRFILCLVIIEIGICLWLNTIQNNVIFGHAIYFKAWFLSPSITCLHLYWFITTIFYNVPAILYAFFQFNEFL